MLDSLEEYGDKVKESGLVKSKLLCGVTGGAFAGLLVEI
jgi:hypothetical protein